MNTQEIISSINEIGGAKVCKFVMTEAIEGQPAAVKVAILNALAVAAKLCDASDDYADKVIPEAVQTAVNGVKAVHPEVDADRLFAHLALAVTAASAAFLKNELA
jgi:hypothetical protein